MHMFVCSITWFLVAFIPMTKVNATVMKLMYRVPLNVRACTPAEYKQGLHQVIICTYRAFAKHYFRDR